MLKKFLKEIKTRKNLESRRYGIEVLGSQKRERNPKQRWLKDRKGKARKNRREEGQRKVRGP